MRDIRGSGRLAGLTWRVAVVATLVCAFALIGATGAFAALSTTATFGAAGGTQVNGSWTFLSGPGTITLSGATASSTVTYKYGIAAIPQEGPGWPEIPTPVVISTYAGVVSYSTPGQWQLVYYSQDASGNVETAKTALFILRSPAPDTISDVQNTYIDSATITLVAAAMPGGASVPAGMTFYKLDGGATVSGTSITTGLGAHTLEFWSLDSAGNTEVHNYSSFDVIHGDAPVTSDDAVANYLTSATINLTVAAEPAGVTATTYFSLDGGDTAMSNTVVTNVSGAHVLKYWSVDNYGNIEAMHTVSFSVLVDTTAPTTVAGAWVDNGDGSFTIHLNASDDLGGSGMANLKYSVGGGATVTQTGSWARSRAAGDHAGPPIPTTATDADIFVGGAYVHTGGAAPMAASMCGLCHLKAAAPEILTTQRDAAPFADVAAWQAAGGLASDFPHASHWACAHCHTSIVAPTNIEGDVVVPGGSTIEFWGTDNVGNVEDSTTLTAPGGIATTVSQNTPSRTSVVAGQVSQLSGAVTPDSEVGNNVVVWVKKPGKAYWSYSSNRTVYLSGVTGHAAWQYNYLWKSGMTKGVYTFHAQLGTAWSGNKTVTLH